MTVVLLLNGAGGYGYRWRCAWLGRWVRDTLCGGWRRVEAWRAVLLRFLCCGLRSDPICFDGIDGAVGIDRNGRHCDGGQLASRMFVRKMLSLANVFLIVLDVLVLFCGPRLKMK